LGPDLSYNGSGWDVGDVIVFRVNAAGTDLDFAGYIGGDDNDGCYGLALDDEGCAYLTGWTLSEESTFPVKVGPDLTYNGGTAWVGDGYIAKVCPPTLLADTYTLAEAGGSVNFSLEAGSKEANRNYLILGSATGTEPGIGLPGGLATLPLTWDPFTELALSLTNTAIFSNFAGSLDASGQGFATLHAPSLPPGSAGWVLYFAYCLNQPFDFASNPVAIEIVP
jgi:hypothetical protein